MILLDGKTVSEGTINSLKPRIKKLNLKGITPKLAIFYIGQNEESLIYSNMKMKKCDELGILYELHHYDEDVSQNIILQKINELNKDSQIHGIVIQLPLPEHLDTDLLVNTISYKKDIDGFHSLNAGELFQNRNYKLVPCTPRACIELLDSYKINVESMNIVIIGCSNLVGLPLSILLLQREATVTICHKKTINIKNLTKQADMIITCCGVPHLVKEDWIKENTIIIDVGINTIKDSSKKKGYKIVGDVDFNNVKHKCSYLTPVPGGVGPITVAILMKQLVEVSERNLK
jgi:5,10-methylene-tetrahydrofolate dehydrogenase/methenyl tetrahydrofolate cyclohydrolase